MFTRDVTLNRVVWVDSTGSNVAAFGITPTQREDAGCPKKDRRAQVGGHGDRKFQCCTVCDSATNHRPVRRRNPAMAKPARPTNAIDAGSGTYVTTRLSTVIVSSDDEPD